MVRKRLITVLALNDGVLFRTRNFVPDYRYTVSFVDAWSVDEVVLLDITRPGEGARENFYDMVSMFAKNCFVPICVGGGVRSLDDFQTLLSIGADKIAINTEALRSPEIIASAAKRYGSQCVVVCMDAKKEQDGTYQVYSDFGTTPTSLHPAQWARIAEDHFAGEILVQSIDRDGMLEGYDLDLSKSVAEAVNIPVLLSGGAGDWSHFVQGFTDGRASAVCTSNIYHFTEPSIRSAKRFLQRAEINVRS